MRLLFSCASAVLLVVACIACTEATAEETVPLPELDGSSAKGLEIECRLTKTQFVIGEPVNMWCTVKNTTNSIKPVAWHPLVGGHFCCVQGDKATWEGLLPMAIPHLDRPIMIKSKDAQPGYVLFIPAHESIQILLTHKGEQPVKFKGRIVYDALAPRAGGFTGTKEDAPRWKNELVSSNEFEYEVIAAEQK